MHASTTVPGDEQVNMPSTNGMMSPTKKVVDMVCLSDFSVHGLVGEGAFGRVMMASKKGSNDIYAIKDRSHSLPARCASSPPASTVHLKLCADPPILSAGP